VSEDDHRTKWQRVLADLEDRLERGEITGRFPTDRELVEHYGVSRHTVREAVRRLRARGIVERHRGRGSFVRPDQLQQPVGTLYSLFREVERRGHEQRSQVLELRACDDPETALRLGLPRDADLVVLARLRFVDDTPLAIDTAWLPADIGEAILDADFSRTALYDVLEERVGLRIDAAEETIEPVLPADDERDLLETEPDEALFRIERRGWSEARLVEWRITLVRGRRFAFVSSWQADGAEDPLRFEAR
jgi:GntR family transcriptional regulator